jgi:cation diffusion facilitator family transporter
MGLMNIKSRTAALSIVSNTVLIVLKIVTGVLTGSVSIVSEAIHSTVDLFASVIAFVSVRIADTPPDEEHPYGHEKVENISGVIEALLVFAASAMIIYSAVMKLIHGSKVDSIGLGFIVMFVSAAVNFLVSRRLYKVAKQEDSVALEADALHLKADVYTSLGVGAGLFLIWLTDLTFLDPIVAIVIALLILKESAEMLIHAFRPLIDTRIAVEDIKKIKGSISRHSSVCVDIHEIRTRKSGKITHVDFHLTVPDDMTVKEAHDICDEIENEIGRKIRHAKVLIHTESCGMSRDEIMAMNSRCGKDHRSTKKPGKQKRKNNGKRK